MIAAPEYTDVWIDNRCRKLQDEAFYVAVLVAWRQGLENPPMIGVDTRPGTKNPKFVAGGTTSRSLYSFYFGYSTRSVAKLLAVAPKKAGS
jgi:hypothetical protein